MTWGHIGSICKGYIFTTQKWLWHVRWLAEAKKTCATFQSANLRSKRFWRKRARCPALTSLLCSVLIRSFGGWIRVVLRRWGSENLVSSELIRVKFPQENALNRGVTFLDWKRWSGWLESWEGLLLVTDVSTTCAEAILTLKMASAQVVETSVINNSPSQDSNHPDHLFQSRLNFPF